MAIGGSADRARFRAPGVSWRDHRRDAVARGAATVDGALANAVKESVAHIDGTDAKELEAGLMEAQAGMAG
jgi:hypothetical protein